VLSYRDVRFGCMNLVRYRYRLRPGATAMAALLREWDLCRWVWNQAVARLNESGEWVRDDTLTGVEAVRHSSLLEIRVLAEPGIPAL
jgi:putative transposase